MTRSGAAGPHTQTHTKKNPQTHWNGRGSDLPLPLHHLRLQVLYQPVRPRPLLLLLPRRRRQRRRRRRRRRGLVAPPRRAELHAAHARRELPGARRGVSISLSLSDAFGRPSISLSDSLSLLPSLSLSYTLALSHTDTKHTRTPAASTRSRPRRRRSARRTPPSAPSPRCSASPA